MVISTCGMEPPLAISRRILQLRLRLHAMDSSHIHMVPYSAANWILRRQRFLSNLALRQAPKNQTGVRYTRGGG